MVGDLALPGWAMLDISGSTLRPGGWVEECRIGEHAFLRLRTEDEGTELTCIAVGSVRRITPITEDIGRRMVRSQWPAAWEAERAQYLDGAAT